MLNFASKSPNCQYLDCLLPNGDEPRFVFADIAKNGAMRHYATRSGKVWDYGKLEFFNPFEECEYLCVSVVKNCNNGRKTQNIAYILCNSLDIDGINTLEAITKRLKELRLPKPTIIESSPGKFQLKWYLMTPIKPSGKAYKWWSNIQKALAKAFEDFKVDPKPLLDITRLLRNEFGVNIRNTKYKDLPLVVTHQLGELTDLETLSNALKAAGYLVKDWIKISRSWERLLTFYRKNPLWQGRQTELSNLLGMPLRTLKFLLKRAYDRNLLDREKTGQGGPERSTIYKFKPAHSKYSYEVHRRIKEKAFKHHTLSLSELVNNFKTRIREKGCRNFATFVASVALNEKTCGKISLASAIETLRPGFELSNQGDNDYNYQQFCRTVASGLLPDRNFLFSNSSLQGCGLI